MRKLYGFFLALCLIASPLIAFASTGYILSGFGDHGHGNPDGTYCPEGTHEGYTYYTNGTWYLAGSDVDLRWILKDGNIGSGTDWYFINFGAYTHPYEGPDADPTWYYDPYPNLVSPDPTVTSTTCGGEETPPETPVDPANFLAPKSDYYSYASSTCIQTSEGSTTPYTQVCYSTSTPIYSQDLGTVSFELGVIIVGMFLMIVGFMFNNMTQKKPWR